MPTPDQDQLTSREVLERIRAEIAVRSSGVSEFAQRMSHIRALQSSFRQEPVGGRLLPLKRLLHWFTASAFDRQAKVVEALIGVVEEIGLDQERLEMQICNLLSHKEKGNSSPADEQ